MNKHGARSRTTFTTRLGAGLASILALTALGVTGASADTINTTLLLNQGVLVTVEDGASKGDCRFTVVSVNHNNNTLFGRLNANIRPKGLGAFNTNQHVRQWCWVESQLNPGVPLAYANVDNNGPKGSNIQYVTIPLAAPYTVCTHIETIVESGAIYTSSVGCKNS